MTTWLHFVGSRVYGIRRFEHEAKKLGAQRGAPFSVVQLAEFGDRALVGEFRNVPFERKVKKKGGGTYKRTQYTPTATVFGYFSLNTLVWSNLPTEIREAVLKHVTVLKVGGPETAGHVDRMCGSYDVGPAIYVEEGLGDLAGIIENVMVEQGEDPNDYKWLLGGKYHPIEPALVMKNQPFFHGYKNLTGVEKYEELVRWAASNAEAPGYIEAKQEHAILQVFNYGKRRYVPKEEAEAIDKLIAAEVQEARRKI